MVVEVVEEELETTGLVLVLEAVAVVVEVAAAGLDATTGLLLVVFSSGCVDSLLTAAGPTLLTVALALPPPVTVFPPAPAPA